MPQPSGWGIFAQMIYIHAMEKFVTSDRVRRKNAHLRK